MNQRLPNSFRSGPDERGHFGNFGGRFVAETLMPLILDLEKAYAAAKADPSFQAEMNGYLKDYVGRPSPLYFAERLTEHLGGAKIYLKREELNHTGSHKVNNVLGQIMVARRMGKKRIIAETGAGQHGVATATLCARFGLECVVYMGAVDVARQAPNVFRMEMLGATVVPVQSGTRTLKDAMNEALRDWVTNVHNTFYCIGTVAGPHPYPMMVCDFQSIIGDETRKQMMEAEGRLPNSLVACIGGGSNAMGLFHPFLDDPEVRIVSPRAGETVTMEIGLRIFAEHLGEGTLHVLVDQPTVPVGQAIEEKPWRAKLESNARSLALLLEPGSHRISVQVADARGLATAALDSVEITVQADVEVVPHVFISSPENGDAVRTRFEVSMEASDVIIEPAMGVRRENAGHFFLAVDTEPPAPGQRVEDRQGLKNLVGGEQRLTLIVSQGRHVLILGVADGTNVALEPRDRIEVFGF